MTKKEYRDKWKKDNPIYMKLHRVMYRRCYKYYKKNGERIGVIITDMLGCSIYELQTHLEDKWVDGMNWENHGTEWEIDHIIPLSIDDSRDGFIRLNHYSNLQPLWKEDNRKKSNSVLL